MMGMTGLTECTLRLFEAMPLQQVFAIGKKPLLVQDRLYNWNFPSFYDLANDTFSLANTTGEEALAYDDISTNLFTKKANGHFQYHSAQTLCIRCCD